MKKVHLFCLSSLLLYPQLSLTAQTKNIEYNNNKAQSFLLSDLQSIDIKKIAQNIANTYFNKAIISNFEYEINFQDAQKIQQELVKLLNPYQGDIIGYKAGLTNKKAQESFKVNQPLLGTLLENMLLPSGTKVPANFGGIPKIEGDLMVRVSSEKINEAKTPEETLKYLDAIIPFLELPDLVYDKNIPLNGEMLIAINVGARLGVVGDVIPLNQETGTKNSLKNISVTLRDESGKIIAEGNSNALLGDPLNVVFWIKEQLKTQGKTLKKGDLLSLGSITPLLPVETGKTITAQYTGLEKDKVREIVVSFE